MRIDRAVAVVAVLGAMAVGFAGPALAEDFSGIYVVTRSGGIAPGGKPGNAPVVWRVTPCGSDCAQVVGDDGLTWETQLANGRWTGAVASSYAVDCKNGTAAPGKITFSLDAETFRGTVIGTSDGPACGSPTPITRGPVFITMSDNA